MRSGAHTSEWDSDEALRTHAAPGDVCEEAVAAASGRELHAVVERLPATQREVITLAFYGGLSHAEIAVHLDLPTGTVKGRMRLGLQALGADLETQIADTPTTPKCHTS